MGVNSDPSSSIGQLCACIASQLSDVLDRIVAGALKPRAHTRIQLHVDGEPVLGPCLNDILFAHRSPADMSRFQLAVVPRAQALKMGAGQARDLFNPGAGQARDLFEPPAEDDWQDIRGSGVWVATATGSTAAIRSAGGKIMPLGSQRLQYVLREPYAPPDQPAISLRRAFVQPDQALVMVSRMRSARVWADGPHRQAPLRYGQTLVVQAAQAPLMLIRHDYR
jgi:NAD+ kinase